MEQLNVLMSTVDLMNNTELVLDTVESMVGVPEVHDIVSEDTGNKGAGDVPLVVYPCTQCNDGERAILSSYMSLMRQCIELAEKVGAAKA